jgi:hypothetical protein
MSQEPHAGGAGDCKFSLCHQSRRGEQFVDGCPAGAVVCAHPRMGVPLMFFTRLTPFEPPSLRH